ncbi:MAG: lysophospholipid acyltransferase family protein [Luminiphilus sp.]|jgi:KDO2-lipid IV(A) lauroyltransferase
MAASSKPVWLEWTVILLIHLMITVTRRLPLSWARALGRGVGALLYYFNPRMRRVAIRNLELAYPGWATVKRRRVALQSVQSTAELMAEMGRLWTRPWTEIAPLIEAEGLECIEKPLASGRGVIVLGPHLGNWELLGMHVSTLGDLVALYEPLALKKLDRLVHQGRQSTGATLVPTTPRGLAQLVRAVRNGGITGILPDQVPRDMRGGLNAPFFGVECFTATLAYNLIKRSGAAAVMGAVLRTPAGFRAVYRPAEPEVYSDDPTAALAAVNRGVEKLIMGNEPQYQWQYKRFKVQPFGQVDYYNWGESPLLDEGGSAR